ncbi:pimeloyl-ACP methyl ester carboxylesterase [Sphingomonas jinjuensis]|uniref:Pimeloyl-ACP methyl ester carboxylesterase n=1 Tax=Sphingomonas jinjuensis TaxID=535907 RepID=A0A840F8N0_9SPHN|nr:alpha/beta hydrolase [Sphingomonas jinjuensis]MBB4154330.1 pimeloyl-ACP methyl ester carboxylesterase [Sphingomonas jinjuensis]
MTERPPLAYRHTAGTGPTIMFLPGYASDMNGTKALALEAWAQRRGHAFLRFDYAGCGESQGDFADQTLAGWRDDVLAMIDQVAAGPVVLVGSSMGGWLMLLAALARPDRVRGLVGIAPAPDFTDWGFTLDEKMKMLNEGKLLRANPYGAEPTVYTARFFQSGEANRLMFGEIGYDGPVRLVQGQCDPDVPWIRAARLAELLRSADVQTWLVKDGDHRLSRDADVALIVRAVEDVLAAL